MSHEVDGPALNAMFAPHGTVDTANVISDRDTGRSKGFGFVEMSSDAEAQAAMAALNGTDSGGRSLTVAEAKPTSPASANPPPAPTCAKSRRRDEGIRD